MIKDTHEKLSRSTIALHWVVGITILIMVGMGIYMEENELLNLYPIHKGIGVILFSFILYRVVWRIMNGWPTPASDYPWHEHFLAKFVHWALIIMTILFPVTGFVMSAAGGYGVDVFGLEIVAMNVDPQDPMKVIPHNLEAAKGSAKAHHILGEAFLIIIGLHVIGALKHHFIDKDSTLRRMFGR